ncbi:helix-turn-helix transcriptional regulator [Kineococcus sp. SYSU DK002]|uniref:helix-turn-helix transcriptional regulator n=1 Tax=Kineococcus sp. SYSU DK002 TaxID=3383123 RepID=UPI003D7EF68C
MSELGEYLQARRARTNPHAAGLPAGGGRRRVAGLRREEVAVLADVSVDYYRRLEQGREHHPSAQVLDALARVFDLDEDATAHLFALAEQQVPRVRARVRRQVHPDLLRLLQSWPEHPALVIDPALEVLALNSLAAALYAPFARTDNLARMTFLDPVGRDFFVEHDRAAHACVANLRAAQGADPRDEQVVDLVAELTAGSSQFAELWERHDVRGKTRDAKTFRHPQVGEFSLVSQTFDVRGARGQQLVVYTAEATGSAGDVALRLLGTLAAQRAIPGARAIENSG